MVTAHGARMPVIGFGTFRASGEDCARGVAEALKVGYRAIDTAAGYRNEDKVAEGIRASGVRREEIFITTKVTPEDAEESAFKASVERSLRLLDVDQVDLLLIHWPSKTVPLSSTIATLNACKEAGWTRHIGVSNFTVKLLGEAWAATQAPLVTNQCEYHPYLNQDTLMAACRDNGMIFTAYSPIARGAVLKDPVVQRIAKAKGGDTGPGGPALGYPAGERRRHPEERQPGAHPPELRRLHLHAQRFRDGRDHGPVAVAQAARRQSGLGGAGLGRLRASRPPSGSVPEGAVPQMPRPGDLVVGQPAEHVPVDDLVFFEKRSGRVGRHDIVVEEGRGDGEGNPENNALQQAHVRASRAGIERYRLGTSVGHCGDSVKGRRVVAGS